MKKQLSLFVLILVSLIIAAGGMSNWPRIYIKSNTTFAGGVSGSDSTKNIPQDTVKMWLRAQGFTDTLSLNDSLRALEHRGYITLDSASIALRLAMIDSARVIAGDSSQVAIDSVAALDGRITAKFSLYVPYTGATTDTDLGLNKLTTKNLEVYGSSAVVEMSIINSNPYLNGTAEIISESGWGIPIPIGTSVMGRIIFQKVNDWTSDPLTWNSNLSFVTYDGGTEKTGVSINKSGRLNTTLGLDADSMTTRRITAEKIISIIDTSVNKITQSPNEYIGTGLEIYSVDKNSGIELWGQGGADYGIGVELSSELLKICNDYTLASVEGINANMSNEIGMGQAPENGQKLAVTGNVKVTGVFEADTIYVNGNINMENSASISNPSSGLVIISSETVSVPADSTDVNGVLNIDTLKNASGFSLYNSTADTTQFNETAFKFSGNQLLKGTLQILNGTATTFTQAPNRLTISGDSLSIRTKTNINPWRATSPQSSTFLGMNAGKSGASGADNIVIGNNAGDALTSGSSNVFIGTDAGGANTTGAGSTFAGFSSGKANTAAGSVFYGYNSGLSNTTGINNTYIGYNAGRLNTTFKSNTSLGYQAGYTYRSNGNTSVGNYAGSQFITSPYATGSNNDCFGDSTGVNLTTGKNNKFIGAYSGLNISSGNRNLIFGDYKGGISPDSLCVIDNTGKDSTGAAFTLNMTSGTLARGLTIDGYIRTALVTIGKILFADETPVAPVLDGADTYTRIGVTNPYTVVTFGNIAKTSKSLVITEAGYYDVGVNMSIGCDQATATIHAGIALNNVVQTYAQTEYTSKDAGDVHSISLVNTPLLAVGDSLYLMVKSDAQTDSLRIKHLNFIIKKLN